MKTFEGIVGVSRIFDDGDKEIGYIHKYVPSLCIRECLFLTETSICCCCWVAKSYLTLCNPMDCSMPGFPVLHCLPELGQTQVHWVSDAIQPSHPLSPPSPPDFNLSQHQGLFQWVGSSHQGPKVLELQLQLSPFSEYSGLISFRMDWFDLLAIQWTLKNLQHHSSKASILWP